MTSKLSFLHMNDFSGGLVTNQPASELSINQSPDLDNINLFGKSVEKRRGDSAFCTAMNSGANVQGLAYYKPTSGTEYLVAVAGAKVYKSDSLDGTMDEITGSLTVTANANNIWTFAKLKDLLVGVGGAPDAPFKWSGSGNAAVLGGSPVSGKFCFTSRDRMFIGGPTANPSTLYWSILANPEDWSGTGSGNTTVVTNDGDTLVGGCELNNDISLLFKNYSIHHLITDSAPFPTKPLVSGVGACSKNGIVNVNGVVYFITNEPRMMATSGYNIIEFPDTIDDIWDSINKSRLQYIQGVHYSQLKQIHWYVSMGSATTNNYCIIWDYANKCWLRHTAGYDCNVACVASGYRLFGGHYNGIIYEKDKASTYSDASETSPGTINAYWKTPWINNANNISVKHPKYFDINFKTQTIGNIQWSMGFNYNSDTISGVVDQEQTGGKWDIDLWDSSFIWGGQTDGQKKVFTFGRGNNFLLKFGNNYPNQTMTVNSIDIALKEQGTKDISNP